jgi:hypothetical protein
MVILFGCCNHTNAQGRCPELARLRSEAAEAARQTIGVATPERCVAYGRSSDVWSAIVQYATEHRELCEFSNALLDELEKNHQKAVKARDNVCAARPARAFPPDIIRQ